MRLQPSFFCPMEAQPTLRLTPAAQLPAHFTSTRSSGGFPRCTSSCSACPSWSHQFLPLPSYPRDSIFLLRRPCPSVEPRTLIPAPYSRRGGVHPGASPRARTLASPPQPGPPASINEKWSTRVSGAKALTKLHIAVRRRTDGFKLFNLIRYNFQFVMR